MSIVTTTAAPSAEPPRADGSAEDPRDQEDIMNATRITCAAFEDMKDGNEAQELAAIVNNGCASDQPSARLFKVAGAAVLVFDTGSDTIHEVMDEVPSDAAAFVCNIVADYISDNIASRNEYDGLIASYEWGIRSIEDDVVADGHTGEVAVVEVRQFNDGHEGIAFITERDVADYSDRNPGVDNDRKVHLFDGKAAADAWVAEQEEGAYRLAYDETGHPSYYAVAV